MRDGIIVVCALDIMFLADCDGDGKAEVQDVLFADFATGVLHQDFLQYEDTIFPRWMDHPAFGILTHVEKLPTFVDMRSSVFWIFI